LHFGLVDTVSPFGGIGMMIGSPVTRVRIESTDDSSFIAEGFAKKRVTSVAERLRQRFEAHSLPSVRVTVIQRPPAHSGLGSGTQLDLSVAEGICRFLGIPADPLSIATEIASRGKRSAVGVHGYWLGGLIHEGADDSPRPLNVVKDHLEIPRAWRVALFSPAQPDRHRAIAGDAEQHRFHNLDPATHDQRKQLINIIESTVLPAVRKEDLEAFGEAIFQYNHHSGKLFASAQGGPYNGPLIQTAIDRLRDAGISGVGQSSWGPTIFAFCTDSHNAHNLQRIIGSEWSVLDIVEPLNEPRKIVLS
jgi:beta-RFAP synthase